MNQRTKTSRLPDILQQYVEAAEPYQFEIYSYDQQEPDCYAPPADPESLASTLRAKYSLKQLQQWGLFVTSDAGEVSLATDLLSTAGPTIALRGSPNKKPWALLTPPGRLIGSRKPPLGRLINKDARTRQLMQANSGLVFATMTGSHAGALRMLGLPAAPWGEHHHDPAAFWQQLATDLEAYRKSRPPQVKVARASEEMDRLGPPDATAAEAAQWRGNFQPPAHEADRERAARVLPPTVVLPVWHPHGLSEEDAQELRELAARIAQAELQLDLNLGEVAVWEPSSEEQIGLRFVLQAGRTSHLQQAICDSVQGSSYTVAAYRDPNFQPHRQPQTVAEALAAIETQAEAAARFGIPDDPQLYENYEKCVDGQLRRPLQALAAAARDPLDGFVLSTLADTASYLHTESPQLRRELRKLRTGDEHAARQVDATLKRRDRHVNQCLRLLNAFRSGKSTS